MKNPTSPNAQESFSDPTSAASPEADKKPMVPATRRRRAAAAPDDPPLEPGDSLSVPQCRALENLMSGLTMGDAAKAAGVGRRTLYRWMHEDAHFRAAHNAWQSDTIAATRSSVLALTEPAIRAVSAALDRGDAKTAMQILSAVGALTPPKPGSSDVEHVRKEQQIARKREETSLFMADMEADFPA